MTTIFDAVRSEDIESVRTILAKDPQSVEARDSNGATPLAVNNGNPQIALLFE